MYATRRPNVIAANKTIFVPNLYDAGVIQNTAITNGALTANQANYLPFSPAYATHVQSISVWCVSGTTQNFDIGLYDESFVRLGSLGSTGIASTTGIKTWTPATPIPVYASTTYLAAFACDSATPTWVLLGANSQLCGTSLEASAFPLPATGTPSIGNGVTPQMLKIVFSG